MKVIKTFLDYLPSDFGREVLSKNKMKIEHIL